MQDNTHLSAGFFKGFYIHFVNDLFYYKLNINVYHNIQSSKLYS